MGSVEGVSYVPLDEADWSLWRAVRLHALADAPQAFITSLNNVLSKDTEAYWRGYFPAVGRCFVAQAEQRTLGMARVVVDQQIAPVPMLMSLWVDPAVRGEGIAAHLVWACNDWVQTHLPGQPLRLEVNADNAAAIALYEKLGFVSVTDGTAGEDELTYELRAGTGLSL